MVTAEKLKDIAFKVQHGKLLTLRDIHLNLILRRANNTAYMGLYKVFYCVHDEELKSLTETEIRILIAILKQAFQQRSFMSEIKVEHTDTVPLLIITLHWDVVRVKYNTGV